MKGYALALGAAAAVWAGAVLASHRGNEPFPHAAHEGLFPVCEGCHLGAVTGVESELFPAPASCAQCHDGTRADPVEWQPRPGPRVSNLSFFHPAHQDLVELMGDSATCRTCHAVDPGDPSRRMHVSAATPEACLGCHAHAGPAHLAGTADCTLCHVPLTRAPAIPAERIALFPRPDSHDAPDFLLQHAPDTPRDQLACSVCHARNSCERCHVNAARLEAVTTLDRDPRVAALEARRAPEYPVPASHLASSWAWTHGTESMRDPARCSTCHTRESCLTCHVDAERPSPAILFQEAYRPGGAPGVELTGAGARVHPVAFARVHGSYAATGVMDCTQCHVQRYCADCHDGVDSRRFHLDNFLERHALEVFGGGGDCQSCHSTEAFCRDCHLSTGVASRGRLDTAFHTAQPLWILAHGQAARIGLEACASCHRQTDCLACHSSVLGRGVNPHGPGFDAARMAARNRVTCRWCHLGDPLSGA